MDKKDVLRMTTYPREVVVAMRRHPPCLMGYAAATSLEGMSRDIILTAASRKELAQLFKAVTGNEVDERGVYRVAIMNRADIEIEDRL